MLVAEKGDGSLRIELDCGVDDKGKAITKIKSFPNIKSTSENAAVYSVAKDLGNLQSNGVQEVTYVENTILFEHE